MGAPVPAPTPVPALLPIPSSVGELTGEDAVSVSLIGVAMLFNVLTRTDENEEEEEEEEKRDTVDEIWYDTHAECDSWYDVLETMNGYQEWDDPPSDDTNNTNDKDEDEERQLH